LGQNRGLARYTLFCGGTIYVAAHAAAKQNVFAQNPLLRAYQHRPSAKVLKQTMSEPGLVVWGRGTTFFGDFKGCPLPNIEKPLRTTHRVV